MFKITPDWVKAGAAIFTVSNDKGEHYTYRVSCKDGKYGDGPVWFAALLTGPDNESDYTYLGMMGEDGSIRTTRASKLPDDSTPVKVLRWALKLIWADKPAPEGYGVNHEGRCGKCARPLTAPEGTSPDGFRFGFGPICWGKLGGAKPEKAPRKGRKSKAEPEIQAVA